MFALSTGIAGKQSNLAADAAAAAVAVAAGAAKPAARGAARLAAAGTVQDAVGRGGERVRQEPGGVQHSAAAAAAAARVGAHTRRCAGRCT